MIARARSVDSTTVTYVWSDVWSAYHNGGESYDQAYFAGPIGRTSDAIAAARLDRATRIVSWWYEPQYIANMTRSAQFFEKHGYTQLQATWCDTTNMTQAAALSIATPNCLGGVATTWPESGTDHRRDIQEMVQRFWNTPWKQVYFADFNPNEATSGVTTSGGVSVDTADTTLAMLLYPPGANHGAMRWDAAAGSLTLPDVGVDSASQALLSLHARGAVPTYAATKTIRVKPRWVRPNGSTIDGADAVVVVGGPGPGSPSDFNRYTVRLQRPEQASSANRLRVIVSVDASAGVVASDNVCVWESMP
jgi:hypothetical protein